MLLNSETAVTSFEWHHVAVSVQMEEEYPHKLSRASLYVDGVREAEDIWMDASGDRQFHYNTPVILGKLIAEDFLHRDVHTYFFVGKMDEVRFWNKYRYQVDIQRDMHRTLQNTGTLIEIFLTNSEQKG